MPRVLITLSLLLLACVSARADIEKIATPCETGFCFQWWPKLPSR